MTKAFAEALPEIALFWHQVLRKWCHSEFICQTFPFLLQICGNVKVLL